MHQGDALAVPRDGVLDRRADQPLAAGFAHRLYGYTGIGPDVPRELFPAEGDQPGGLVAVGLLFLPGVHVLRVLAEDDHVHLIGMTHRTGHAGEPAYRPQAYVQVEDLAQRHVQAADAAPHGRGQGPLDAHQVFPETFYRFIRKPAFRKVEGLFACQYLVPRDAAVTAVRLVDRGVENALSRPPDIRSRAVAFDERDDRLGRDVEHAPVIDGYVLSTSGWFCSHVAFFLLRMHSFI